jgi:hypothetical protein
MTALIITIACGMMIGVAGVVGGYFSPPPEDS